MYLRSFILPYKPNYNLDVEDYSCVFLPHECKRLAQFHNAVANFCFYGTERHRILSIIFTFEQAEQRAINSARIAVIELREGCSIAFGDLKKQVFVRTLHAKCVLALITSHTHKCVQKKPDDRNTCQT